VFPKEFQKSHLGFVFTEFFAVHFGITFSIKDTCNSTTNLDKFLPLESKYVESECCNHDKQTQMHHIIRYTLHLCCLALTDIYNPSTAWSFNNISTFDCLCFSVCLTDLCCSAVNRLFHTSVSLTSGTIVHLWRDFCQFPHFLLLCPSAEHYPFSLLLSLSPTLPRLQSFFDICWCKYIGALNNKVVLVEGMIWAISRLIEIKCHRDLRVGPFVTTI